ncbi:hypothetical protein [Paraclostridium sordellii]|uniref:hypothetical protein n=1 Tax=Paraclostridium sordellii TaxID=1505 RepID=UPI0012D7AD27|nr:hypothetical protein [Paeniclostridium sordellii]
MSFFNDLGDFCSVLLAIIILATCCKNLKFLSFIQRIGIVSLSLGILIPASFDFVFIKIVNESLLSFHLLFQPVRNLFFNIIN